ncbi:MAG: ABC transporter permease, partial [Saprospiraceae bacterium]
MLYLQLKIALRNLWRYRLHTGINILGLAIGICACFVIIQLVRFDYNFDEFHTNKDRIYRLYSSFSGEYTGVNPGVPTGLPTAIENNIVGIEQVAPLHYLGRSRVEIINKNTAPTVFHDERGIAVTSPAYFDIFTDYKWLHGSPATALSSPYQVVLSEQRAQRYFGTTELSEIIGREVIYRDSLHMTVSGIVANFTENSDLIFEDFISLATAEASWLGKDLRLNDWVNTSSNAQTYVLLAENTTIQRTLPIIQKIYDKNREQKESSYESKINLQPLHDLHFNGKLGVYNNNRTASKTTLFALLSIALILLVIAGINFVNLATAQAMQRSKEVGVRKVLGGTRGSLVRQFLGETFILTTCATLLALLLGSV